VTPEAAAAQPYWSAIAQIVPVLALALVLEVRAIARRLARKKAYPHNRGLRVTYAVTYFFAAAGLILCESLALRYLLTGGHDDATADFVTTFITLAFWYVALGPIFLIGAALMGDVLERAPWSHESRVIRRANRIEEQVIAAEREARSLRLEAWSVVADAQIELVRLGSTIVRLTGRTAQATRAAYARTMGKVDDARTFLVSKRLESEASVAANRGGIDEVREALADVERTRRLVTEFSKA
jgi:hypothetical protein